MQDMGYKLQFHYYLVILLDETDSKAYLNNYDIEKVMEFLVLFLKKTIYYHNTH